jgi:aspartyl-tRNA synthetase
VDQLTDKKLLFRPFERLSYHEAMERFGTDRPDMRFRMELADISDIVAECDFRVFSETVAGGGLVKGLNAQGCATYSRRQIDDLADLVKEFGAKGLAWVALDEAGDVRSSFAKFVADEQVQAIVRRLGGQPGDLLLFVADRPAITNEALNRLRVALGDQLGLRDRDVLAVCWVVDFPFVEWDEEEQRWDPSHHLFTAPVDEDIPLLDSDPGQARPGLQWL